MRSMICGVAVALLTGVAGPGPAQAQTRPAAAAERPRVIVLTDIEN